MKKAVTEYVGRLVMYNRESHLEPYVDPSTIKVGDLLEVVRGNGPREGASMGTATITEFREDGGLALFFHGTKANADT